MTRQANTTATPADMPEILPAVITRIENTQTALTLEARQHDAAVRAVAHSMGYQLPADCTDPDMIQRDISANMRRSVEACLQVGMGLAVLKTACAHGEFTARLDVLGIDKYVASRFMNSAAKFSKLPSTATLKALGSQTKLFEMLCLGDDQLEELELTGQTGDLSLDDVATMSVKELRKAVREERAERAATQDLLDKKNKRIDALEGEKKKLSRAPASEVLKSLKAEASACATEARAIVFGPLAQAVNQLCSVHDNALFAAALLGEVQRELNLLRDAFSLPDVSSAQELQQAADVAEWGKDA
jgi:hypothetical protein